MRSERSIHSRSTGAPALNSLSSSATCSRTPSISSSRAVVGWASPRAGVRAGTSSRASAASRARGTLMRSGPGPHADLAVVLENREVHILDAGTACPAQRRFELVLRQALALHHVAVHVPVMDEHLRSTLDDACEALVPVGEIAHS